MMKVVHIHTDLKEKAKRAQLKAEIIAEFNRRLNKNRQLELAAKSKNLNL